MATFQVLSLRDCTFEAKAYKRRRAHQKRKSGCFTCRAKRVKCDEKQPICSRCQRNQRTCSYPSRQVCTNLILPTTRASDIDALYCFHSPTVDASSAFNRTNDVPSRRLLYHFLNNSEDILHLHTNESVVSMSKSSILVENIILAASASHLRYVSPQGKHYATSEHYYQSLVIRSLQEALSTPQGLLKQTGAKELLLSMILLNMVSFPIPDCEQEDPENSWVFSEEESRLNWLALQTGLRPVLLSLTEYIEDVIEFLGPIFMGENRTTWDTRKLQYDWTCYPRSWNYIFKLQRSEGWARCDPSSEDPADLYRLAANGLLKVRHIEPVPENSFLCLLFINKISLPFRNLLYQRDPRALWLLGYWMGLMCRYTSVWWLIKRVKRDHSAILSYLEQLNLCQLPGEDGSNWAELIADLKNAPKFRIEKVH